MNIFNHTNYREFLRDYLDEDEKREKGARKRLLSGIGMSSSLLTQILTEKKQLSLELAYETALHIGLSEKETDYFMLLIDLGHAGSYKLQDRIKFKLKQLKIESEKISSKITQDVLLTEEQKYLYYSSWVYTAVRNLVPTPQGKSIKMIAEKLDLPESAVERVVQFLLEICLLVKTDQELGYKPGITHLDSTHPLINRHHQNWRQRAIHRMDHYNEKHLHYTSPMSMSFEGAKQIRLKLANDIKQINQLKGDKAEVAFCLNIDFFEY